MLWLLLLLGRCREGKNLRMLLLLLLLQGPGVGVGMGSGVGLARMPAQMGCCADVCAWRVGAQAHAHEAQWVASTS